MPYLENLSIEERHAIQELKNCVNDASTSPALIEDAIYYRFLKGRDFNVHKAEKLLRKHIEWRKLHQVDKILDIFKPKEIFVKYIEPSLVGYDKDGDIIRYFKCGTLNNTEIMKCIKIHDYMKHWIWFAEKNMSLIKQQTKKTGNLTTVSFIIDLDELEFENATSRISIDICLRIIQILRNNYRESVKSVYVINAPSYYVFIYMIIKGVVSHALIKKVHVFSYGGWKEKLLEVIDADILPSFLGGKRTDPDGDPYCRSFITIPEKISERCYLSEEERYFKDPTKINTLVIRPSEKKEIFVLVEEVGSSIRWKFMVKKKTIGFALFFQESQKVSKEIIPMYEYDTPDGTVEDSYMCFSKGKYIISFDNSCSRFTTKELHYIISVEKPEI